MKPGDLIPTKQQMIRMRNARMGCVAIAKAVGCNPSTIRYWLRRYGLPTERAAPMAPTDSHVDAWITRFRGGNGIKRAAE